VAAEPGKPAEGRSSASPGPGTESRLARLGALLIAPRRLLRRDLDARDGTALDDFLLVGLVALALHGTAQLVRASGALAAGRSNAALHMIAATLRPAMPLILLWLLTAILLRLFAWRAPIGERHASGELAARVASGFVLVSLLVGPLANAASDAGPHLRVVPQLLPWLGAMLLFGVALRETLDAVPSTGLPARARRAGLVVLTVLLLGAVVHVHQTMRSLAGRIELLARRGQPAPEIDLPTLDGGRLRLSALRGQPVVLSFWASWCGPCRDELPVLARLARATRTPVYAVNIDEASAQREPLVRRLATQIAPGLPVALDDGRAATAYSITAIPTAVRIGGDGLIEALYDRPLDEAGLRELLR
jgi:cytochrome c biogenesis protein CcmG, thiol:disulfide interchange protein DsbE